MVPLTYHRHYWLKLFLIKRVVEPRWNHTFCATLLLVESFCLHLLHLKVTRKSLEWVRTIPAATCGFSATVASAGHGILITKVFNWGLFAGILVDFGKVTTTIVVQLKRYRQSIECRIFIHCPLSNFKSNNRLSFNFVYSPGVLWLSSKKMTSWVDFSVFIYL